jgi:hypothetical protein
MTLKIRVKEVATQYKSFNELERGDLFRKVYEPRTTVYLKLDNLDYSFVTPQNGIQGGKAGGRYTYGQAERHMHNCVPINGTLEIES